MNQEQSDGVVSRRWIARAVLLGGGAAGVAAAVGSGEAQAAPVTDAWKLGGNSGVAKDGTNFLGPTNVAPLIIKTAPTKNNPQEAARFTPNGFFLTKHEVAVATSVSSVARLNVATDKATGTAALGTAPNSISSALGAIGVQGVGTVGVQGTGEYMGVQGTSLNYAVFGYTSPDTGGIGSYGRGAIGVKGRSYSGQAVLGDTDDGTGVKGESYADGGSVKAIHGEAFGVGGNGVVGEASNGAAAYGVWGISNDGYAGVFSGKVLITGTVSKGGGSFKIDHPLDPANKYLYHSFVESPDMMNVYNGNVRTNASGRATVRLPDYFMALNRDFRYQLTVLGQFAQAVVGREIEDGSFEIHTDKPHVRVSWQVTGIRQDAFANAHRIPVVEEKAGGERGTFLHPEAQGKSASAGFQHARLAAMKAGSMARQPDPVAPR
jgi:hypothetical protein